MKKIGKLVLAVLIAVFSSVAAVNAASKCSYDEQAELNNAVANIKVSYEEAEGVIPEEEMLPNDSGETGSATYNYFKISVYNLTEDFYVKITNDYNAEVKYLYYKDNVSGVVTYDWFDIDRVTNFKLTFYSSNTTSCSNEEYRIANLITPRYNDFSLSSSCIGNEDFYLCQKYTTEAEMDFTEFSKELELFENDKIDEEGKEVEQELTWQDNVVNFIKENKIAIAIISTIIVVGGVVTTVIVIKKRRSRLI